MNTVLSLIILLSQSTIRNDNITFIAATIIKHLENIENMSVKSLANLSYTSTTTIIKFCQLLGFKTYLDFRQHLVTGIKTRKEQLNEKCLNLSQDNILNMIKIFSNDNFDIQKFNDDVDKMILEIEKFKSIHFYGAVFPLGLLESFSEDMAIMSVPIYVHQMPYNTVNIEKNNSLNVIVTISGRFFEINKKNFDYICNNLNNIVLISKQKYYHTNINNHIELPNTISSDYDEVIYLLILDLIKYKYYIKRFSK